MSEIHKCDYSCVEHWKETELKCPYCLKDGSDSYEVLRGEGNESGATECEYCGRTFKYGTEITYKDGGVDTLYYNTFQIEGTP